MEAKCETCKGFGLIDSGSAGYGDDFEICPDCREVIDGKLVKKQPAPCAVVTEE